MNQTNDQLVEKAKRYFYKYITETGPDKYNLWHHVPEVERWAKKIIDQHPEADGIAVLLAVWFHDIAHYLWKKEGDDHAVMGEEIFMEFCRQENVDKSLAEKAAHCIRAHRNNDVTPASLEAKIVACADSASHMTGIVYIDMIQRNDLDYILGKLDRDFRDLGLFPDIQRVLEEVYRDWKSLLTDVSKTINSLSSSLQ